MKRITQLFKNLLVLLILTLTQCQTEEVAVEEHNHLIDFKKETGTFVKFNLGKYTAPLKIYNNTKTTKSNLSTQSEADGFYFIIDTTSVLRMSDGITESFTIKVKNAKTPVNSFQNLIIAKYLNNAPKAYLKTYFPDQAYKNRIKTDKDTYYSGRSSLVQLDINNIKYQEEYCVQVTMSVCNYGGEVHAAGSNCTRIYTETYTNCIDSPGGGSSGSTGGTLIGGSGSGSGSSGQGSGSGGAFLGIPTNPIDGLDLTDYLGAEAADQYNFIQQNIALSGPQMGWVTANAQNVSTVYNYLSQNNTSVGRTFILQMINTAITNNATFSFNSSLNASNSINFNSISDMQNYFNALTTNQITEITSTIVGDTKIGKIKTNIGAFTFLNVEVNQTLSPYAVNGVSSSISGNTLCLSYDQKTPDNLAQVVTNNNIVTVTFSSSLNINALNDNIGTLWTFNITIVVKINKLTGEIININVIGLP
jgi:uncharacterized membrane protein YgcG